ncbi:MAG: MBL fold metallo-hydrolase [Bdellovibrio bacteriovorus]
MEFRVFPVTPFEQNCTLLWCERTRRAAIVDPGGEPRRILDLLRRLDLTAECILLTHGHIDHVGAAGDLAPRLAVPIIGPHRDDDFLLRSLVEQGRLFGFPPVRDVEPDRWLEDGDEVTVGEQSLGVIHCPGHTPGHVVFFDAQGRLAQVGDVLFRGAIGRTDFPRGDYGQLITSITQRLFPLGDDVRFIPGHGPMSTLGAERRHNPYVGERAIANRHI